MSRIILGVDPGLTRCGFGLVRVSGSKVEYVHAGVIRTSTDLPVDERLHGVWLSLLDLINEYLPAAMAVERVDAQVNLRTVMGTAQVSGLALTLARLNGLPVSTYTPTEMKAAVTGSGRADKVQVTAMVQRLLKLSAPVKPADASDALGLAICHAWRGSAQERIATALAAARP